MSHNYMPPPSLRSRISRLLRRVIGARAKGQRTMNETDDRSVGLRWFLVGLCAFILGIWGPDPSFMGVPGWVIHWINVAVISAAAWGALKYVWRIWKPNRADEDRLSRAVAGALAGALLLGAVLRMTTASHEECTYTVPTRDGTECVGDYVTVAGPDLAGAVMLVVGGAFALWYSISKPKPAPLPDSITEHSIDYLTAKLGRAPSKMEVEANVEERGRRARKISEARVGAGEGAEAAMLAASKAYFEDPPDEPTSQSRT